jgi:peptidyl-prolyl cis-trans isomerase SurA
MNHSILSLLLIPLLTSLSLADGDTITLRDAVVAVVNQHVITRQDVEDHIDSMPTKDGRKLSPQEKADRRRQLYSTTAETLITRKLLRVEADRLIKAHPVFANQLERQARDFIENERTRAGGDKALRKQLKERDLTYESYAQSVREQIKGRVVIKQFVENDLSVSPAEMKEYYRKHSDRFLSHTTVQSRMIIINAGKGEAGRKQALKTARYVHSLAKKNHDFAKLAKGHSDGPDAGNGGWRDYTRPESFTPPAVAKVMAALPVRGISEPIETETGFLIIKVEGRRKGRLAPYEEVQAKLEKELRSQKRKERMDRLLSRLEKEHYVKRME